MSKRKTPPIPPSLFPSQGEIIRWIANAFDIKASNKKLDDYARHGDTDYQLRDQMIKEVIYHPIESKISKGLAKQFSATLKKCLDEYLVAMLESNPLPLSRREMLPFLIEETFEPFILKCLSMITSPKSDLFQKLCEPERCSLTDSFEYIEEHIDGWNDFYSSLNKENKDKLRRWRNASELPSFTGITVLDTWGEGEVQKNISDDAWEGIKTILLFARALDSVKRNNIFQQYVNGSEEENYPDHNQIKHATNLLKIFENIFEALIKPNKTDGAQKAIRQQIDAFEQNLDKLDPDHHFQYAYHRLEALWHVLSGNNKSALKHYKETFKRALFNTGEDQIHIIEEARVIAAQKLNRTFLKRLKNQAMVFKVLPKPFLFDASDNKVNNKESRLKGNIIEDWEVEIWKKQFAQRFPREIFFQPKHASNAYHFTYNTIKPDYVCPNSNIKIPVNGRIKKLPQLQYFITIEEIDVVKKLLTKGASVDALSDAGDSALLLATHKMSVLHPSFTPAQTHSDRQYFDLISSYPHKKDTLNQRTTKLKLTILTSAIGTGQPDIVEKVLDMGADVNQKATLDDLTPLYFCLQIMGNIRDPERLKNQINNLLLNSASIPIIKDAAMRYSNGMVGSDFIQSSEFKFYLQAFIKAEKERIANANIHDLYKILDLLLKHGADPNATQDLRGNELANCFTPLMYAAEQGDVENFKKLVEHGGDPEKTFWNKRQGREENAWDVARYWNKKEILELQTH